MFCGSCGKDIHEGSAFCAHCGVAVVEVSNAMDQSLVGRSIADILSLLLDEKSHIHQKYLPEILSPICDYLAHLGTVRFESFIRDHRDAFNAQPYSVIDVLKDAFTQMMTVGYLIWIAERLSQSGDHRMPTRFHEDALLEEWKRLIARTGDFLDAVPPELEASFATYTTFKQDDILSSAPSLKQLPVSMIDALATQILATVLWGYFVADAEYKTQQL